MPLPNGSNPTDDAPYYVLLLRAPGVEVYTNEAGSPDRTELIAKANRALMAGSGTAMVVKVEFWEGQGTQGRRDLSVRW